MTQAPHLGGSSVQQPSLVWDTGVTDMPPLGLGGYPSLLGNKWVQTSTVAEFDEAELFLLQTPHARFGSSRPESKLAILKRQRFTPEGREARIAASLAVLDAPQPTNLSLEQWKAVAEEVEDEDED